VTVGTTNRGDWPVLSSALGAGRAAQVGLGWHQHDRLWIYDGQQFMLLAGGVNYYAKAPAPATIAQFADMMDEKYGLHLPLEALFGWDSPQTQDPSITSAMFVGPSRIDGVTCGHYAFRQEERGTSHRRSTTPRSRLCRRRVPAA
jgi:hypothetical protein